MKSKQLVLIAIALLCGLVSAIGIIQAMGNSGDVAEKIPMGPVLVASAHLDHKAELTEENVSLENWPTNLIPEGAATDFAEVKSKFITTRLRTGQAIILDDVFNRNEIPGLAIPPNHKVINIKVPPEDLLGGLLRPGDRVDIIGIFNMRRGGEQKSETKTFLKGIRVFNIGASTSAQDSKKNGSASGIVGVLVTESQSEKIVWAKKNGEIRLAMIGDNVAASEEDPDFPMDEEEPEATPASMPSFDFTLPKAAPKFDKSKLRQVKVYSQGTVQISYFDDDGNQIEVQGSRGSMGPPVGMPSGARGLPPVDYEGFDGSAELPNGIEEDQYRGE
ncbi:Flp pilus assembly protein CpaB [Mariniblastus fucicola]|uniref:SAF domain-containing protein n=1 Tax=Mariniblastus fucicola TaxID=980251 RepID=A0A5B9P720_9BACT|nr:Flp pilus assembly protein CpaB [Mariniblastus fucicola]QEG20975.1 hypothetical protein MFFC18_08260 [Mariniblastus fucicola]